jgi:Leucine-rich repeat (LRR) protein
MEEYDDLSEGPNKDGSLNLSYNNWDEIPKELYKMYSRLLKLSLSHNHILKVSNDIGKLTMIRELDLSHNFIEEVDPAIGNLVRLRSLNLSNNKITCLPSELCSCKMMVCRFTFDNRHWQVTYAH